MEEKTIKTGRQVIREFIAQMVNDPGVDKATLDAIDRVLGHEGKLSITKALSELERHRKE